MSRLSRLLPSLTDFAFLMPVIFLFTRMNGIRALLGDGDTGWHVRTGEWILSHRQVPTHDLFSFTKAGQTWYAWEWLSDVLMAAVHRFGGLQGVALAAIGLICVTFFLLYRFVAKACENVAIAFGVTALTSAGSAIHWLARPHLFSLLLTVVFLRVLAGSEMRRLWVLPVLTVIWTNLHGGFLVGLILTGAYTAGEGWAALTGASQEKRAALRRAGNYGLTTLTCFVASFINPYTWHLHAHVAEYLVNPAYTQEIAEFLPISFRHPLAHFYEPMLLLSVLAAFRNLSQRRLPVFLLILGWAHLSLLSSRNIPLFLIISAAPVAEMLANWLATDQRAISRVLKRLNDRMVVIEIQPCWHLVPLMVMAVLALRIFSPTPGPKFRAEYDPAVYPKLAMAELRPTDRVFTDDEWGDYVIYHSHPTRKVFVDGRSDFYGPAFEKTYLDILHLHAGWKASLKSYGVNTVLARVDTPLAGALTESGDWRLVHNDGVAMIFRQQPEAAPTCKSAFSCAR